MASAASSSKSSSKASSNKAKIAKRVIEVLEFFDDSHREATVMDIVRRYNRPQSSTSELLSSLVDLGLLYKDPYSRSYSLTPRAALLGTAGQSGPVRDGRLVRLVDRLAAQTGLSIAIFGMVGLNVQVINWRRGTRHDCPLLGGAMVPLSQSAAGWLLLSTIAQPRVDGMVRRLIAEAAEDRKFAFGEMSEMLHKCRDEGHARGPAGFGTKSEVLTVLLPEEEPGHPLAIGFVYNTPDSGVQVQALLDCLNGAIRHCLLGEDQAAGQVEVLQSAA